MNYTDCGGTRVEVGDVVYRINHVVDGERGPGRIESLSRNPGCEPVASVRWFSGPTGPTVATALLRDLERLRYDSADLHGWMECAVVLGDADPGRALVLAAFQFYADGFRFVDQEQGRYSDPLTVHPVTSGRFSRAAGAVRVVVDPTPLSRGTS